MLLFSRFDWILCFFFSGLEFLVKFWAFMFLVNFISARDFLEILVVMISFSMDLLKKFVAWFAVLGVNGYV